MEEANYSTEVLDSEYVDVGSAAPYYGSAGTNFHIDPPHTPPLQPNPPAPYIENEPADDELKDRLFSRLYGDKEKAFRIVNALKRKHSERSERWCWEKALDDLIYDR